MCDDSLYLTKSVIFWNSISCQQIFVNVTHWAFIYYQQYIVKVKKFHGNVFKPEH